jgi:hypothetical protein
MNVRVALAVATAALLLSAASCTGDNDTGGTLPPTTPATSPTPSTPGPSTSSSTTPPPEPTQATQDSPAGAESFARFYLVTLDYANRSGDTRRLRTLGGCAACRAQADGIDRFYLEGGRIEGGDITVESSTSIKYVKTTAAIVNVVYSQREGRALKTTGEIENVPAQPHVIYAFTLKWTGRQWQVSKLQPID